jgi:hypothetical protein
MSIRFGIIEYERSSRPVNADTIRQLLSVAGKDVIRLAWSSLNPDSSNDVKHDALAVWFCEFFNLTRNDGQGSKCIRVLCDLNILYKHGSWVKPEFDL